MAEKMMGVPEKSRAHWVKVIVRRTWRRGRPSSRCSLRGMRLVRKRGAMEERGGAREALVSAVVRFYMGSPTADERHLPGSSSC